ncbi:MAG: ubiquitin-protein ligase Anaphase Promoting Complex [Bogoriella megaspora]|nr:MAG: ubiquitin-protein ligase Anaphase Promoting Complex [Bogoriella megaspora]
MKVTILEWHAVAAWRWDMPEDDVCGICRVQFEGTCPKCKYPGDDCPLVTGECAHSFHMVSNTATTTARIKLHFVNQLPALSRYMAQARLLARPLPNVPSKFVSPLLTSIYYSLSNVTVFKYKGESDDDAARRLSELNPNPTTEEQGQDQQGQAAPEQQQTATQEAPNA